MRCRGRPEAAVRAARRGGSVEVGRGVSSPVTCAAKLALAALRIAAIGADQGVGEERERRHEGRLLAGPCDGGAAEIVRAPPICAATRVAGLEQPVVVAGRKRHHELGPRGLDERASVGADPRAARERAEDRRLEGGERRRRGLRSSSPCRRGRRDRRRTASAPRAQFQSSTQSLSNATDSSVPPRMHCRSALIWTVARGRRLRRQ